MAFVAGDFEHLYRAEHLVFFCFSDAAALGASRVLAQHRIPLPQQIALVGIDGIEDGEYSTPALTTVAPDKRSIASSALDRLEAKLRGDPEPPRVLIAPHELILRESA